MKKLAIVALVSFLAIGIFGCNANERAKNFGGTMTIDLPRGKKLVTVTWKEDEVWYLTRDMKADETPESYEFKEKSSYGMLEGKVVLRESK